MKHIPAIVAVTEHTLDESAVAPPTPEMLDTGMHSREASAVAPAAPASSAVARVLRVVSADRLPTPLRVAVEYRLHPEVKTTDPTPPA